MSEHRSWDEIVAGESHPISPFLFYIARFEGNTKLADEGWTTPDGEWVFVSHPDIRDAKGDPIVMSRSYAFKILQSREYHAGQIRQARKEHPDEFEDEEEKP